MQTGCSLRLGLTSMVAILTWHSSCISADSEPRTLRGDKMLADYFRAETAQLSERCLAGMKTLDDWVSRRVAYRQQLLEMLGLSPLPQKTDLHPVVTGKVEADSFSVEKLHFQSMPGLYVTANLYLPKNATKPAPTVLYVCGHGPVKTNNISYGNKVAYQHHGIWFARHGYVCLIIDTLQLGEIEGIHHGTYRYGSWWWNSRGYTPAGVETWNSIRALDYLSTRSEVDTNRFGITGRSGGGAYTWFTAALDDRIKVAAPVAGITDLHNHVVDGTVEGHCDCMFLVNTYRWDYPQLAAMIAPRPLLFCNSDKDTIFPLDGVLRTHEKVRRIYQLYKATTNLGLLITEGPHQDTQDLQLPVFRWFNRHLKGEDPVIEVAATKLFTPQQLKVFDQIPGDHVNTSIQDTFVPVAPAAVVPQSAVDWNKMRDQWLAQLKGKAFGGWPEHSGPLDLKFAFSTGNENLRLDAYDFVSQPNVSLRLYAIQRPQLKKPDRIVLHALDQRDWNVWFRAAWQTFSTDPGRQFEPELANPPTSLVDPAEVAALCVEWETGRATFAYVAPRGVGPTEWSGDAKKQIQIRRRFMLLGETLDSMRVWDIRRAIQAARSIKGMAKVPLWLEAGAHAAASLKGMERLPPSIDAGGSMAVNAIYAALFEASVNGLELWQPPRSHGDYASVFEPNTANLQLRRRPGSDPEGPDYLNVMRVLDIPQAIALAAERSQVRLFETDPKNWDYPVAVVQRLGWSKKQLVIEQSSVTGSQ